MAHIPTDQRRTPRATVDTRPYEANHGRAPQGTGYWIFENAEGEWHGHTGTYTEAKRSLPAGEWTLQP